MERTTRDTLIAFLVGGGISAVGLYWGYPSLAVVTGLCWAGGLKLTLRIGHLYPAYATGETWADKRWSMLGVGLVSLAGYSCRIGTSRLRVKCYLLESRNAVFDGRRLRCLLTKRIYDTTHRITPYALVSIRHSLFHLLWCAVIGNAGRDIRPRPDNSYHRERRYRSLYLVSGNI